MPDLAPQPPRSSPAVEPTARSRIAYLDGLRGVAILIVVLFHSYARWPDRVPALKTLSFAGVLDTKIAGVQLFFFISGYVILMTLERKGRFAPFLHARWMRLFPAMLICSILIFATAGFLPGRPAGDPRWIDLLPGLSLLGDRIWDLVPGIASLHPKSLEGAFWSLYVEVVFYLIFGALFVRRGPRSAIKWLIILGVVTNLFYLNSLVPFAPFTWLARADKLLHISHVGSILGLRTYVWFAAGALAHLAAKPGGDRRLLWGALACLAFGALSSAEQWTASLFVAAIAAAAILSEGVRRLLSLRLLTFIGFISYPLYLMHENMIVGLMVRYQTAWSDVPAALLPVAPILFVGSLAYLVARFGEPALRAVLDATWTRGFRSKARRPA